MKRFFNWAQEIDLAMLLTCVIGSELLGLCAVFLGGTSAPQSPLLPAEPFTTLIWTMVLFLLGLTLYFALHYEPTHSLNAQCRRYAIILWVAVIVFQILLPLFGVGLRLYVLAFVWQCILLGLCAALLTALFGVNRWAMLSLVPYVGWIGYCAFVALQLAISY